MKNVLQLNEISPVINEVFAGKYNMQKDCADPVGIVLRSFAMQQYTLPKSVMCVARAGAGVNNIPVDRYTTEGVVVFNTPGANANAVKELVLSALLLSSRKIVPAIDWVRTLKGKGAEVGKLVEKGKGSFVGPEILGKTLGVIGLGAIGVLVANAAITLGMNVIGYDPFISIDSAWNLNHRVKKETDLNHLYANCDYITLHIPFTSDNKGMIGAEQFAMMKDGSVLINCSRGELVDNTAVLAAVKSSKLSRYFTDFPSDDLIGVDGIVAVPHLGASTPEAEDNCATMAAQQLVDFVENGNITNSVNFAQCSLPRSGVSRITVIHKNVKSMLTKLTDAISTEHVNIANLLSQSRGDYAYTILDLDDKISAATVKKLEAIDGVVRVRNL